MTPEAKMYLEGKTIYEIAEVIGVSPVAVWKRLKKQSIQMRPAHPRGRWAHKKRGTEYKGADGRWWVRTPQGRKRRAVWVMEQKLGHLIPDGYHVHHKDENIENDHPDNLELVKAGEHSKIHHEGVKNPAKANRGPKKLTDEVIKMVFSLRSKGWTQQEIAREMDLHQTTISRVLRGK